MVLLIIEVRLDPLTVKVTVTVVEALKGVTTTEDAVDDVGVAPLIAQEYVGLVTLVVTADKVAFAGVNKPPAF